MKLLLVLFLGIPATYFFIYGGAASVAAAYILAAAGLGFGYALSKFIFMNKYKNLSASIRCWNLRRLEIMLQLVLVFMLISAFLALKSFLIMGEDYRLLFFTEQKEIFGFERYGFILQLLAEYGGIVLFCIILTTSNDKKWRCYLLVWVLMGTIITFGRWFILYGIFIYYLTENLGVAKEKFKKDFIFLIIILLSAVSGVIIFNCRGESCELEPTAIGQGVLSGVVNYFYIPLEMFSEYEAESRYGMNLFFGFAVYPINFIGKMTGLYNFPYEYDKWALQVQDYVNLENIGIYNALVGQPLTSFVSAGYFGVFVHYLMGGLLVGKSNKSVSKYGALQIISITVLSTSYLMPTLSGPMFLVCLVWYAVLLGVCRSRKTTAA